MVNQPQHFTCIGKGHGAPAIPATREDWENLRNAPWLAEMCRRIAAGDEALKAKLPVWTPGCAEFKNNHRALADALKPLPRLMLDFDEKGHSAEILAKAMELQAAGKWKILLVEESVRRGTHVLIALPEGMTPQEAQQRFSNDIGFVADPALKDVASRCIYMVPKESTLFVSEELFMRIYQVSEEKERYIDFESLNMDSLPLYLRCLILAHSNLLGESYLFNLPKKIAGENIDKYWNFTFDTDNEGYVEKCKITTQYYKDVRTYTYKWE
mgnify:CR=1 FL=1